MRKAAPLLFSLVLSGVATTLAWGGVAWAQKPPVVVELFTAQGCSSCGKANQVAAELAKQDGVLALTYSVDYWDYLGWKDTFAKPVFAERQRAAVARALAHNRTLLLLDLRFKSYSEHSLNDAV